MAQKKVKRHLHKGRVACAVLILIIIIIFISNIAGCTGKKKQNPSLPADNTVTTTETVLSQQSAEESQLIICVDAGHGGSDSGSLANYTTRYEKDDNLSIALATQKYLEKIKDVDMKIIMTRTDDTFVSLDDRCSIANNAKADLFVSLHRNSAENANGVEVWVHSSEPAADCRLAYNILMSLQDVGISKNKGVRFGYIEDPSLDYQVNRETNMPSCLVEVGFMSSVDDNALFDRNVDRYGEVIAESIVRTAKELGLKGLKADKAVEPIETEYYNHEVTDYIPDPSVGNH